MHLYNECVIIDVVSVMKFENIDKELQQYRKIRDLSTIGIFLSIIIFFVSTILGFLTLGTCLVLVFVFSGKCKTVGKNVFNNYIVPKLEEAFDDFKYNEYSDISDDIIYESEVIDIGNRIRTSVVSQGYYRDVSFVQTGVISEHVSRDSDGDSSTTTLFKGRLIILGVSLFDNDGVVKIISHKSQYSIRHRGLDKTTLNKEIENYYNIYVSGSGLSIPEKFLDHIMEMTKSFPQYIFNFKVEKDRLYVSIDNIVPEVYSLESVEKVTQENIDLLIKKDSYFITNTISNILD